MCIVMYIGCLYKHISSSSGAPTCLSHLLVSKNWALLDNSPSLARGMQAPQCTEAISFSAFRSWRWTKFTSKIHLQYSTGIFLLVKIMDLYILYMNFQDLIDFRLVTTLNIQNFGPTKKVNNCEAFRLPHKVCFTHSIVPSNVTNSPLGLPAASPNSSKRSKQKRYAGSSKGIEST